MSLLSQGIDPTFTSNVNVTGPFSANPLSMDVGSGRFGISTNVDPTSFRSTNKPKKTKNSTIQHAYPLRPWGDGREEKIMEFMPVFIARYYDKKEPLSTMLTVGQFNNILRQAHQEYKSYNDQDKLAFDGYMERFNHGELEYYHHLKHNGINDEEFMSKNSDIVEFHRLATQDVFRYQTLFGILDRYNWLGVVLTKAQGTSLMAIDMTSYEDHVNVINVVVGEKARVHNYWGSRQETMPGSTLFWVLKRSETKTGPNGAFQITGYSSKMRDSVPASMSKDAHVWRIGTISENNASDISSESSRQAAMGLTANEAGVYSAVARLPIIIVQLGI